MSGRDGNAHRQGDRRRGLLPRSRSLRGVDGGTLRRLAADAQTITLRGGDYPFRGGDAADRLYVVRAGRLRVLVETEDGPRVGEGAQAGDVLGEPPC